MKITKDSLIFKNRTYRLNNEGKKISDGDPVQTLEMISIEFQSAFMHINTEFDRCPCTFLYVDDNENGIPIQIINDIDTPDFIRVYMGQTKVEEGLITDVSKDLVLDIERNDDLLINFKDTAEEPYLRMRIEDSIKRLSGEPVEKREFFKVIDGEK